MTDARLMTTAPALWLPQGSSAETWVGHDCQVREPVIVTRLLIVRRNSGSALEFFCVPSPKGANLPTRYLLADHAEESSLDGTAKLIREIFGHTALATRCVGFIRNVVPSPDENYKYPSPWAHIPVHLVLSSAEPAVAGEWFDLNRGHAELSQQHWWRIVEHFLTTAA
ncbi:hypothetical protein [Arthrobacter sp. BF1]|uniref:hypothetical protein n=1 Tax=Arthrobacter sp. BF1 TaxID=2821145 RepID=UPI001C4EFAD4|nr:hypothetical protein [Arthrobacter sp. BF1]